MLIGFHGAELKETEDNHKKALRELEEMRNTMEKMEEERAEMIAEVEAQIERALANMAVDAEDSEYGGSRPSSRLSSRSAPGSYAAFSRSRGLRSFGTDSTLAESFDDDGVEGDGHRRFATETVAEVDEEEEDEP